MLRAVAAAMVIVPVCLLAAVPAAGDDPQGTAFFEKHIRPLLVEHCYACHSEQAKEQQGGLLLDRRAGWLKGGDTQKAVVPGEPDASLLIKAVRYEDEDLQMPPESRLTPEQVRLLEQWVRRGAPGPAADLGDTAFSRLGDQPYLFEQAQDHWAFQPLAPGEPPEVADPAWNQRPLDQYVFAALAGRELSPSRAADPRTLLRRLSYDLTGLPPTREEVEQFVAAASEDRQAAIRAAVDRLIGSPAFGEHLGRMWLDVARYADTDSFYRPDTRTPHYFPFAFTYRDYVVEAFNADKPFDQFVREQLAADLLGLGENAPELAALGFFAVGPHANRSQTEALDDWIDVTSRGLLGLTAACARCHDHKFEPIPTKPTTTRCYGVFNSLESASEPLDEARPVPVEIDGLPADSPTRIGPTYETAAAQRSKSQDRRRRHQDQKGRNAIARYPRADPGNGTRASCCSPIDGGPVRAMAVKRHAAGPIQPVIVHIRGEASQPGREPCRVASCKVLDPVSKNRLHTADNERPPRTWPRRSSRSGESADRPGASSIACLGSDDGAPTWSETPSDFGLQGEAPDVIPKLLDWLAADFVAHGWSLKHLVRTIVHLARPTSSASRRA